MSDTSIIQDESYNYETNNDSYRKRDNCWTRIGANICVGLLTLITIVLLIALIFTLYRQYEMEEYLRVKAQKKGKKIDLSGAASGFFSLFKNTAGGSSDSSETTFDIDDYAE